MCHCTLYLKSRVVMYEGSAWWTPEASCVDTSNRTNPQVPTFAPFHIIGHSSCWIVCFDSELMFFRIRSLSELMTFSLDHREHIPLQLWFEQQVENTPSFKSIKIIGATLRTRRNRLREGRCFALSLCASPARASTLLLTYPSFNTINESDETLY